MSLLQAVLLTVVVLVLGWAEMWFHQPESILNRPHYDKNGNPFGARIIYKVGRPHNIPDSQFRDQKNRGQPDDQQLYLFE